MKKTPDTGDLACCDLLLLIEKSPLTENYLKQQIPNATPILAVSGRGLGTLFALSTVGITSANLNRLTTYEPSSHP
jgi:hypothetical protein